jgi:hypothetical protein
MSEVLTAELQHCLMNSIAHSADLAYRVMAEDAGRPHVLMRPAISLDGASWCAMYGANLQDGVCGFGKSPFEAMQDFDRAWYAKATP